jgi:hypothetical protein
MFLGIRGQARELLGHSAKGIYRQEFFRIGETFNRQFALPPEYVVGQPRFGIQTLARKGKNLRKEAPLDSQGIRHELRR